jgi:hypothetical protein
VCVCCTERFHFGTFLSRRGLFLSQGHQGENLKLRFITYGDDRTVVEQYLHLDDVARLHHPRVHHHDVRGVPQRLQSV